MNKILKYRQKYGSKVLEIIIVTNFKKNAEVFEGSTKGFLCVLLTFYFPFLILGDVCMVTYHHDLKVHM